MSVLQGDAVFWYNLMHDGSGDYLTRHAACPVLIGEKWGKLSFFSIVTTKHEKKNYIILLNYYGSIFS